MIGYLPKAKTAFEFHWNYRSSIRPTSCSFYFGVPVKIILSHNEAMTNHGKPSSHFLLF